MFNDTKDDIVTRYADVIKDRPTVYGKIMTIHVYPEEESSVPGNFEVDLTLDSGELLEASVPAAMIRTLQERAFEPAIFVINSVSKNDKHFDCQAILFGAKTQTWAA
jgi:hypothetical protein